MLFVKPATPSNDLVSVNPVAKRNISIEHSVPSEPVCYLKSGFIIQSETVPYTWPGQENYLAHA